ncbi:MAG: hypothetical protein ACI4MM_07095, partial [Candidatus Ventricola sp.]
TTHAPQTCLSANSSTTAYSLALHLRCNGFIIFNSRGFVKSCVQKISILIREERNAGCAPSYRRTQMRRDQRSFDKKTLHAAEK